MMTMNDLLMKALSGDVPAYNQLGVLFKGKDDPRALGYFRIGSEKGDPVAKNNLADMLEKGQGGESDVEEAKRLYAEVGRFEYHREASALADYRLGKILLQSGDRKGIILLERAVQKGNQSAACEIARMHGERQLEEMKVVEELRARAHYEKISIAALADPENLGGIEHDILKVAFHEYGLMLMNDKNPVCITLFEKAAEFGYADALNTLGRLYQDRHMCQDLKPFAEHFSAQLLLHGNASVQYECARLLMKSKMMTETAYKLLVKAVEQGHQRAKPYLYHKQFMTSRSYYHEIVSDAEDAIEAGYSGNELWYHYARVAASAIEFWPVSSHVVNLVTNHMNQLLSAPPPEDADEEDLRYLSDEVCTNCRTLAASICTHLYLHDTMPSKDLPAIQRAIFFYEKAAEKAPLSDNHIKDLNTLKKNHSRLTQEAEAARSRVEAPTTDSKRIKTEL